MAEQEQQHKASRSTDGEEVEAIPERSRQGEDVEELKNQIDGLLDEIDEVLESNAEDFVKGYVQKGGE